MRDGFLGVLLHKVFECSDLPSKIRAFLEARTLLTSANKMLAIRRGDDRVFQICHPLYRLRNPRRSNHAMAK